MEAYRRLLRLVVLLVLLALLTLLVVKRKDLTAEEAEDDAVRAAVKLEDTVDRDDDAAVAFIALVALFAFVTWIALRANEGEDKVRPPARESSASSTTPFRERDSLAVLVPRTRTLAPADHDREGNPRAADTPSGLCRSQRTSVPSPEASTSTCGTA